MNRRKSGSEAEEAAARHLRAGGYKILERNFRTPLGEIDIIALDGRVVCFVEVRSRSTGEYGGALEALTGRKMRRLSMAAMAYIRARRLENVQVRFDFAAVETDGRAGTQVKLVKNAFCPREYPWRG